MGDVEAEAEGSSGNRRRFFILWVVLVLVARPFVFGDSGLFGGSEKLPSEDKYAWDQSCRLMAGEVYRETLGGQEGNPVDFLRVSRRVDCQSWHDDIEQSMQGGWSKDCAVAYWEQQARSQYLGESPPDPYMCG